MRLPRSFSKLLGSGCLQNKVQKLSLTKILPEETVCTVTVPRYEDHITE